MSCEGEVEIRFHALASNFARKMKKNMFSRIAQRNVTDFVERYLLRSTSIN